VSLAVPTGAALGPLQPRVYARKRGQSPRCSWPRSSRRASINSHSPARSRHGRRRPDWVHRGRELASRPDQARMTSSRRTSRSSAYYAHRRLVSGTSSTARSPRLGVGELTPVKVSGGARPATTWQVAAIGRGLLGRQGDPKGVRHEVPPPEARPETSSSTGEAETALSSHARGALRFTPCDLRRPSGSTTKAGTLSELHRRLTAALAARRCVRKFVLVDDGSIDDFVVPPGRTGEE